MSAYNSKCVHCECAMPTGVLVCRDCSTNERAAREVKLGTRLTAVERIVVQLERQVKGYKEFSVGAQEPILTHLLGKISGLELALELIKKERQ